MGKIDREWEAGWGCRAGHGQTSLPGRPPTQLFSPACKMITALSASASPVASRCPLSQALDFPTFPCPSPRKPLRARSLSLWSPLEALHHPLTHAVAPTPPPTQGPGLAGEALTQGLFLCSVPQNLGLQAELCAGDRGQATRNEDCDLKPL